MSAPTATADASRRTRSRQNISQVPYMPGLDGMRALAVVAVIVYHANATWLQGGFIGVEVFFVISGYLITLLLIAEHEKSGSVDMRNFWVRRFRRLLPALFVMMLLLSVWTALFERDALGKLRGDIIGGLAYVSNWYQIWTGAGYSAGNDFAPLRHLWSLAVEEQFYIVWPIVMVALLRKGSRRVADLSVWLFAGAVAVTVGVALLFHSGPIDADPTNTPGAYWEIAGRSISKADALYLSTISRSSGLLLGAAFAMVWRPVAVMRGPLRHKARSLDGLAVVGLAVLALMSWRVGFIDTEGDGSADGWLFRGGFFVAGLATLMMIAAVTHSGSLTSRALSGPTLLWIGTRSYGLYLYHWPIFQIVRNTAGTKLQFHEFVLCLVATAAITEASYRFVETPIRKGALSSLWKRRGQRTSSANRGAVSAGVFVGTALAIFAGASLATAELKQNEVAESLAAGGEVTCNVLEEDCFGVSDSAAGGAGTGDGSTAVETQDGAAGADAEAGANGSGDPTADDESAVGQDAVDETPTDPGATDTTVVDTTVAPAAPIRVAIGDSVMKGAAAQLTDAGFVVDAEESRAFIRGIDVVQGLISAGRVPDQLVIHLGTNGEITQSQMDQMMALVADVRQVVLVRNDIDRAYAERNNALIVNAAAANPNVQALYWDGLAGQCQGDCIYQDGIHLKSTGAAYYVQLIESLLSSP